MGSTNLRLKALNVPGWGTPIEIASEGIVIGREKSSDVVIASVDFPHVSSRHARVTVEDGVLVVADLKSKNGTLVDGQPVETHTLRAGEIVQLGYRGPKFLVVSDDVTGTELEPTMLETADVMVSSGGLEQEADTIIRVKRALGLPDGASVDDLLRARTRRNVVVAVGVGAIVLAVVIGAAIWWDRGHQADLTDMKAEIASWRKSLAEFEDRVGGKIAELEQERSRLRGQIDEFANAGTVNDEQLADLRERLRTTDDAIDQLKSIRSSTPQEEPLVALAVKPASVLVRVSVRYRQVESGEWVYRENGEFNCERRGRRHSFEAAGSGFCISRAGEILTNAHVVEYPELDLKLQGWTIEAVPEYWVSFVGRNDTQRASVVKKGSGEPNSVADIALLEIQPFDEMPYAEGFRTDATPPRDGDKVYLLGFPLEAFTISTGVVTRWREFLSIDFSIHPGASGGAVVDSKGNIVAIAKGRRIDPVTNEALSGWGIAIPISEAHRVWP